MGHIVSILVLIGEAFWFYLPALFANVSIYLVWFSQGKNIDVPVDLYHSYKGHRVLGDSRSIAGFFIMVGSALLVGILQGRAIEALYLGTGAYVFTLLSSLIKRFFLVSRGKHYFLDHMDFFLGSSLFYLTYATLPLSLFLTGFLLCFGIHAFTNFVVRVRFEGRS